MVFQWWWLGRVLVFYLKSSWTDSKMTTPQISFTMQVVSWKSTPLIGSQRDLCPQGWLVIVFIKTITRLAHLVLKLLHIPPSAAQIPKHVSNLIVSCAEFQARPPSCSSPFSWEPLLCSSLTKISLPTKKINNHFKILILFSFIYLVSWFRLPRTLDTSVRNLCQGMNIWCPL